MYTPPPHPQPPLSRLLGVYNQIRGIFNNKQPIILQVIEFLERHRLRLNDEMKLNNYVDECVKKRQCLLELENQQADYDYFDDLERKILSS